MNFLFLKHSQSPGFPQTATFESQAPEKLTPRCGLAYIKFIRESSQINTYGRKEVSRNG